MSGSIVTPLTRDADLQEELVLEFLEDANPQPIRMDTGYCACSCWGEYTNDDLPVA
jgi:hypothetical protein